MNRNQGRVAKSELCRALAFKALAAYCEKDMARSEESGAGSAMSPRKERHHLMPTWHCTRYHQHLVADQNNASDLSSEYRQAFHQSSSGFALRVAGCGLAGSLA